MLYVRTLTQEEKDKLYNLVDYDDAKIMERAKIILFSSQGYDVTKISQALNRHPQSVRPWIKRFNKRGIEGLFSPKPKGAERKFTDEIRKKIVAVVLSKPADLGLPFTNWSLAKVVAYLIKVGIVDKISHEMIRIILAEKGIAWREAKRCLVSNDPDYEMKKQRVMELYENPPKDGVVVCIDEKGSIGVKKYGGNCWAKEVPKVENRQQIKDKVELFGAYAPHSGKLILEDFSLKNSDSLIQFIEVVKKNGS